MKCFYYNEEKTQVKRKQFVDCNNNERNKNMSREYFAS